MASTKEYLDFVLGQINDIDITYKKMMGDICYIKTAFYLVVFMMIHC